MMQATTEKPAPKWRKTLVSSAVGGVIGFIATIALMRLHESGGLDELGVSELAAAATALLYLLMGIVIGLGAILPGAGARYLNFEDESELQEQRRQLAIGAPAVIALGLALGLVALAGPGGIVPPPVALGVVFALWLAVTLLTIKLWREMDELEREVSRDCGNVSYYLLFLVGCVWALFSYLGFTSGPAPLDWLTMFHALPLVAAFIAAGPRGLLKVR